MNKPTPSVFVCAIALATAATTATGAHAANLVGLTSANELARFSAASPGMATVVPITGLAAGDRFVGIDLRPSNNMLYGITQSNRIYTLDEMTGQATFVAALSAPVVTPGLGWGIDFNPERDYVGAPSLRFISSAGGNFAINVDTGAVGNLTGNIAMGFTAVAYTNSAPGLAMGPTETQLYYIDSQNDTLVLAPSAFNAPTLTTIGPLGIDVLRANGFELTGDNTGYAALNVDDGSLNTGIYRINLMTGQATLMGEFNGTLTGLSVSAVPEPGTYALMLGGLGLVAWLVRRRRV